MAVQILWPACMFLSTAVTVGEYMVETDAPANVTASVTAIAPQGDARGAKRCECDTQKAQHHVMVLEEVTSRERVQGRGKGRAGR